jgi:hypothetical protein
MTSRKHRRWRAQPLHSEPEERIEEASDAEGDENTAGKTKGL